LNVFGTSFINVYIYMTTNVIFFLHTDPPLDTLNSTGFWHVAYRLRF